MLVQKSLVDEVVPLLQRGDKTEIARRLREKGLSCTATDVSHFFTGYRTYHSTPKGKTIYLTTLEILEARKKASDSGNSQLAQRLRAIAA